MHKRLNPYPLPPLTALCRRDLGRISLQHLSESHPLRHYGSPTDNVSFALRSPRYRLGLGAPACAFPDLLAIRAVLANLSVPPPATLAYVCHLRRSSLTYPLTDLLTE
jgi:hypothetical protein